ncbi:hypothetical protein ACP26L_36395 (plasmid) [Paenibacillus sp. S-38]|uniref:hypothetical protein n=1 Tax=Paenibacillus sp. S-38 TaxID=3416710 RepID=UPI003CE7FFA3
MAKILQTGYEAAVRSMLGVKKAELPDEDINQRLILGMAEAQVIKRVPEYAVMTSEEELIYLETAVISYICYLLCPSMARRVNTEVSTIDVKWKKAAVNWADRAAEYLQQFENAMTVLVPESQTGYTVTLMGIAKREETTEQ